MLLTLAAMLGWSWLSAAVPALGRLDLDWLTRPDFAYQLSSAMAGPRPGARPVALIDIDEAQFDAWGSPATVPRQDLFRLVEVAAVSRPAAIVLDIDLSLDRERERDATARFLDAYAARPDAPPLILVRGLAGRGAADAAAPLVDAAVARSPTMQWAGARFEGDEDWQFRRFAGVHLDCRDGIARAYPSVPLASLAATGGAARIAELDGWLALSTRQGCGKDGVRHGALPEPPAWMAGAAEILPIPFGVGDDNAVAQFGTTDVGGRRMTIFARLKARDVLREAEGANTGLEALAGRVVLVGATYPQSRDLHRTPLGTMPGVLVLANLVAFGETPLAEGQGSLRASHLFAFVLFLINVGLTWCFASAIAALAIAAVTVAMVLVCLAAGMAPEAVHVGTLAGLGATGLFAFMTGLVGNLDQARQEQGLWRAMARFCLTARAFATLMGPPK